MQGMFNGMFGKIQNGMCRLSYTGGIAVKTGNGYKTYDVKKGKLINCTNFALDIGNDFFFVIPTNKVEKGDIILVDGKPRCVIEADKNSIKAVNYENSTVENILPERHVFMGNTYFYGKIVSMFNFSKGKGKKNGFENILKYKMMSEMMGGKNGSNNNGMSAMLPFMMMNGSNGFADMFDGMFDFDEDIEDNEDEDEKENE